MNTTLTRTPTPTHTGLSIQRKYFEFLSRNFPKVMDGADIDRLTAMVFDKGMEKTELYEVLERTRDIHTAGFLSLFASVDQVRSLPCATVTLAAIQALF